MGTLSLKVKSARFQKPVPSRHQINKERQQRYNVVQQWLCRTYPEVFNVFAPKPLAIGIRKTIIANKPANISASTITQTLARWTRKPVYLNAIAGCDFRYHLDGTQAGAISDRHKTHAREMLAK
jgi:sRNA-binding protein